MDFQQSRTYANLFAAFDAELISCSRSLIAADRARQEQYIQISSAFETVARNNKAQARVWLRYLNGGTLPSTADFLISEAESSNYYGSQVYRDYARVALEEGYDEVAALFNGVANIDLNHSVEFLTYYDRLIRGELFCRPEKILWICIECGNILNLECAPEICPVCGFPQGYYQPFITVE